MTAALAAEAPASNVLDELLRSAQPGYERSVHEILQGFWQLFGDAAFEGVDRDGFVDRVLGLIDRAALAPAIRLAALKDLSSLGWWTDLGVCDREAGAIAALARRIQFRAVKGRSSSMLPSAAPQARRNHAVFVGALVGLLHSPTRGSFDYVRALVADPANERIDVFHARSLTPAMRDYAAELFGAGGERVRYIAMGETPDWLERAATGGPYTYHFWCEDALGLHVGQLPMLGPAIAFTCADLAPVQFADVYWYGQDETYIRALWRRQGAPERFIENYRFLRSTPLNLPKPSAVRARAEIGVGPAETLLASVGNRLGRELDQPFVDGLAGFLLKRPNVRWMAVGGLPDYWTSAFGRVLGRQFIHVLYDEDLAGLLGICDVFANPFRVGGGHSSVIAIDAGAAVLARGDLGDVGALVPREHRAQGVADYFDKLDRLVAEPDLRASWLDAQRAYLAEIANPATFAAELSDVCDLAYRRFAERLPIDLRKLFAQ